MKEPPLVTANTLYSILVVDYSVDKFMCSPDLLLLGCIPWTLCEDNNLLDVLILVQELVLLGCFSRVSYWISVHD
ncbi:Inorganic pyrophosphatase superfamily [Arabidopsis suecica]|uniref:Inorganic pyrophosphatase superfamily n=1 Tax=Arabidopsis suecica TaxID=45249 RepID=A0A8T1ZXA8_ARASU|nr:Inorganic pyrophosphatase superfamily [Arabidopsis suecica]